MTPKHLSFLLLSLTPLSCQRAPRPTPDEPPATHQELTTGAEQSQGRPSATGQGEEKSGPRSPSFRIVQEELPLPRAKLNTSTQGLSYGKFGVVTSVEAQATGAGIELLEAGGNAVDAAVATAFALAVTHPSAGSLGGGGFLLVHQGQRVEAVDFREDSPRALTEESFWKMIRSGARGGAAVGVPGVVAGLLLTHERHGRLPLARVLAPAERLAREGYLVGARQAQTIGWSLQALKSDPAARELLLVSGRAPRAGARLTNLKLADVFERIRERGVSGFYEGETAADLIASLGEAGILTIEDLARYRAKLRAPLVFDHRGFRVVTMPPPSGGGVTLAQNLLQLEALQADKHPDGTVQRMHLLVEASKRAQVERRLFVTDPDTLQVEERDRLQERWLDPLTWLTPHPVDPKRSTQASTLDPRYADSLRELEHTTHLSVIDREGSAVSCTLTLSSSFGAKLATRETGIVLNNAVASFSSVGANLPAGGRRTVSSMTPTLLFARDQGYVVLGTPGGDTIPSTLTQIILHLTADGMSLSEAVLAPRVHQGFVPDEIGTENTRPLPPALLQGLRQLGHRSRASRARIGDANSAFFLDGFTAAISDPREGGKAEAARAPAPLIEDNGTLPQKSAH